MSTVFHPISENPRLKIRRLVQLLVERQDRQRAAQAFLNARDHTTAVSEQIAYALDARLVMHPELLATADDYPGWTPGGAR